ncbi:hypothetical protein [Cytobacillus oceanisediminis]|uniref:hypothetical protein n=1 Tax=Cytobacillus oceanisediminis TaxID=665099 RepID=UPI0020794CDE|nr:hypothetical protein [Cytobacillus oceanisediminis]USK45519.1 hypothetical protein LIT27_06630 [Cytobacillus oceanisediminis]
MIERYFMFGDIELKVLSDVDMFEEKVYYWLDANSVKQILAKDSIKGKVFLNHIKSLLEDENVEGSYGLIIRISELP